MAVEAFLDPLWPVAAIGVYAPTGFADIVDADVGDVREDDEFQRPIGCHLCRHAGRQTRRARPGTRNACFPFAQIGLEKGLILRRQRRLLSAAGRLARIEPRFVCGPRSLSSDPLALEVRILESSNACAPKFAVQKTAASAIAAIAFAWYI